MKRIIAFLMLVALCGCCAAINDDAMMKASQYKGYDELTDSITEIQYKNRTYYLVSYTKTLMPSGSVIIDAEKGAVEDMETIRLFSEAEMIHRNYPAESVGEWLQFADYFLGMSKRFAESDPNISADSRRIGELLTYSATYLNASIASLSPDYTELYLSHDRQVIDLMAEAYERTPERKDAPYISEYRSSLLNIRKILMGNMEGIETSGGYMAELMHERIVSEKNRPITDTYIVAASVSVILFVLLVVKRAKKPNSH